MHIVMLIAFGLLALAAFVAIGRALGSRGVSYSAPKLFIWVWFAASLLNGAIGVVGAGVPLINEIGAFIPIFGIPAGIAWWLVHAATAAARRAATPAGG